MNKKTIIAGAAALGLSGLAWVVTENEIRVLNNKALNYDIAVEHAKDPAERLRLEQLAEKFTKRAVLLNKFRVLNPWTYVAPHLRRLYGNYGLSYRKSRQY